MCVTSKDFSATCQQLDGAFVSVLPNKTSHLSTPAGKEDLITS